MKKAIIFGATSGIGKELAILLSQNGYQVGIIGRREDKLLELLNTNEENFITKSLDLTKVELVPSAIDELISNLGGLDLVIISSGCGNVNRNLDYKIEKETIDLNVSGFTAVIDHIYNYLSNNKYGYIVGITSVMGLRGSCAAPAYSATKAYQINYLESLRQRAFVEKNNVMITDIRPGYVDTDMMKGDGHFWVVSAQKAAIQIYYAINNHYSVVYITKRWRLIGWLLNILPQSIYNRMGKL